MAPLRSTLAGSSDPLGGVSDLKRYFNQEIGELSDEWIFEPRLLRPQVARLLNATIGRLRNSLARTTS